MMDVILSAGILAESLDWREVLACRDVLVAVVGLDRLVAALPPRIRYGKTLGGVLAIVAAGLLAADMPLLGNGIAQGVVLAACR